MEDFFKLLQQIMPFLMQMLGIVPAQAAEPPPVPTPTPAPTTPTLTNVSNKTTTEIAADSNNKAASGKVTPPSGKNDYAVFDIGHTGTIQKNGKPLNQDELNKLTFKELNAGLQNGSIKIVEGSDPGALGNGISEFKLNVLQAYATKDKFEAAGFKVDMIVLEKEALRDRPKRSNEKDVPIFISFHNNSSDKKSAVGSEVYHNDNPISKQFATQAMDNLKGAGYEVRGVFGGDKTQHGSKGLAVFNGQDKNKTDRIAVLFEGTFVSSPEDVKKAQDPKFLTAYGDAILAATKKTLQGIGYAFNSPSSASQNVATNSSPLATPPVIKTAQLTR